MTFNVTINGRRLTASFSRETASEAIDKANEFVGQGVITITDPRGETYSQHQPIELRARWAARTNSITHR